MPRKKKEKKIKIPVTKEEKLKLAKQIVNETNRKYGEVVIKFAKDIKPKERVAFGIETIDRFTGGVVAGNFVIIYGASDVGKSTLVQNLIGNAQTEGDVCALVDLEDKYDPQWAIKNGIDVEELFVIRRVKTAEQAMDIVNTLAKNRAVDLIVIDSIQAFSPRGEQETKGGREKSMDDDEMALLARKLGKFLRVTTAKVGKANIAVVLVGQIRTMGIGTFHTFSGLSGGNALKHWSLITIVMRRGEKKNFPFVMEENPVGDREKTYIGFECVLKLEKKQITDEGAMELAELRLPFYFSSGFRKEIELESVKKDTDFEKEIGKPVDPSLPKRKRGRPKKEK